MTNETLQTIKNRHTTRNFKPSPISHKDLETIAIAGAEAPSSMNKQPWQIIVVTDENLISELEAEGMRILAEDTAHEKFYESIMKRGGKLFYNAPGLIFVAINPQADARVNVTTAARDCGIVVENLALAAHSLGYGSCICGLAGIPLGGEMGATFKERLEFPDGYEFGIAVLVGEEASKTTAHGYDDTKITWIE